MRESIHKYFKVGTIQWMSYPGLDPMESLLRIARDEFFDAIELRGFGEENRDAKRILEQSHLKVCYRSCSYCLKLLQSGQLNVKPLITEILPLEEWKQAFEVADRRDSIKVLLKP